MFELIDNKTGTSCRVYGVHKSGPLDNQTKFLVWRNGWRWMWAQQFSPGTPAPTVALEQTPTDLVVQPMPMSAPPSLQQVA